MSHKLIHLSLLFCSALAAQVDSVTVVTEQPSSVIRYDRDGASTALIASVPVPPNPSMHAAYDAAGNLYFTDGERISRLSSTGTLTSGYVALDDDCHGLEYNPYTGLLVAATRAFNPNVLTVDGSGNVSVFATAVPNYADSITTDIQGNAYLSPGGYNFINRVNADGVVQQLTFPTLNSISYIRYNYERTSLYALALYENPGNGTESHSLVRLNLDGSVDLVAANLPGITQNLLFAPGGYAYFSGALDNGEYVFNIYEVSPLGQVSIFASDVGNGALAIVPTPIPEPSMIYLGAMALLVALSVRLRATRRV